MGLIHNILISIIHLIFVGMDILVMMILLKVIYDRWHFVWLQPFANIVEPAIRSITGSLYAGLSKTTGKSYTDKTLLILFILFLSFVRLIIGAFV